MYTGRCSYDKDLAVVGVVLTLNPDSAGFSADLFVSRSYVTITVCTLKPMLTKKP